MEMPVTQNASLAGGYLGGYSGILVTGMCE